MGPTAVIPLATTTESQELTLLLSRARGLPVKNMLDRSSDPYCVITLPVGDASSAELATFRFQSRTCHRTLEPQWYEEINLPTSRDEQLMQIEMHDDKFWTAKLPGLDGFHYMSALTVALKDVKYSPAWFTLTDKAGKPAGELELHRVAEGSVKQRVYEYKRFSSKAASMLQGKLGSAYIMMQVELLDVDLFFQGARQGWNRDYRSAQLIFGETPEALAIRSAVYSQHAWLYNNFPSPETGSISSGTQLLRLFDFGRRKGKVRAYTYVIVDCLAAGQRRYLFRFSETGVKLAKDYLSKHAMHANGAGEVVYAGEFHVAEEGGENVLVLDNNSGTYAPDKAVLPQLCALFERSFCGLKVKALDRKSKELESMLCRLKPCRKRPPLCRRASRTPPELLPEAV